MRSMKMSTKERTMMKQAMMEENTKMTTREITTRSTTKSMTGSMMMTSKRVREGRRITMITITKRRNQKMPSMRKAMITMRITSTIQRMLLMRRKSNTKTRKSLTRLLELKTKVKL